MAGQDVVIVSAVRTPIGKFFYLNILTIKILIVSLIYYDAICSAQMFFFF